MATAKSAAAAKKAPAKKAAAEKKPAAKAPAKKASASKASTSKAPASKAPAKKNAPAKAAPAKKTSGTKAAPAKSAAKPTAKPAAKKSAPAKPVSAKAAGAKASAAKSAAAKPAVKKAEPKAPVKVAPAKTEKPAKPAKAEKPVKETAPVVPPVQVINPIGGAVTAVRKAVPGKKAAPKRPVVEEDESKWTKTELNQVRKTLLKEVAELEAEIAQEEERFHSLIMESGEGAGDDQADAGAKTFEREHEISILSNKKDLLDQSHHALERIEAGTYGFCENCGKPIGKLRLMEANPRATLCMPCREKEDRS